MLPGDVRYSPVSGPRSNVGLRLQGDNVSNWPGAKSMRMQVGDSKPAIAECPCPGDFISVGIRSTFSKRSISGTAPTTATSRSGAMMEASTSFASMNLAPNGS